MKEEEGSIPLDLMELSCSGRSEVKRELGGRIYMKGLEP